MRSKIIAVFIYGLIAFFPVGFLASFIVSHGISNGREREARDMAVAIFGGYLALWLGTLVVMMVYAGVRDLKKDWKDRVVTRVPSLVSPTPTTARGPSPTSLGCLGGTFIGVAFIGGIMVQAALGIFSLLIMYGVVVLIFRYAFGVELWNPFG